MKILRLLGLLLLCCIFSLSFTACSDDSEDDGIYSGSPFIGSWENVNGSPISNSDHIIEFQSDGTYVVTSVNSPETGSWIYEENMGALILSSGRGSMTFVVVTITKEMFVLMNVETASTYTYKRVEKTSLEEPTDDAEEEAKKQRIKQQVEQNISVSTTYRKDSETGHYGWKYTINSQLGETLEGDSVKYKVIFGHNEGVYVGLGNYKYSEFWYGHGYLALTGGKGTGWIYVDASPDELGAEYQFYLEVVQNIEKKILAGKTLTESEESIYAEFTGYLADLREELLNIFWAEIYVEVGDYKCLVAKVGRERKDVWDGDESSLFFTKWRPYKKEFFDGSKEQTYGQYQTEGFAFDFTGNITSDKTYYDHGYYYDFYQGGRYAGVWKCKNGKLEWLWTVNNEIPSNEQGKLSYVFKWGGDIVKYSSDELTVEVDDGLVYFEREYE